MIKPTVSISIKPHLADFLIHEFGTDTNGHITLRRNHDIGKHIMSHLCINDLPTKSHHGENMLTFVLPRQNTLNLDNLFLYVNAWGTQQINDYIQSVFGLYTKLFFERGYKVNYSQKQIIETFLHHYNIKYSKLTYEAVKKNDYRNNRRVLNLMATELKQSVYQ